MEVFSRRSRLPASPASEAVYSVAVTTPDRLRSFFASRLNEICTRFEEWSVPFTVAGQLGSVSPDSWRRYEPLPLIDLSTQAEIGLEMSLSLLEETGLKGGDIVQATGFLRARLVKGQVMLRFETLGLRPYEINSEITPAPEVSLAALLKELPAERHAFPQREGLRLLLVGLGTEESHNEAFRTALGALWQDQSVRALNFLPADRQKFLQVLMTMTEDILVILSGKEGLPLLENTYSLKALSTCRAYRVLVLENGVTASSGHVGSLPVLKSVASHLVDHGFMNSVEAGRFIREQSSQAWQVREEERARQEEMNALRDSLSHFADLPDASRNISLWRGVLFGVLAGAGLVIFCLIMIHFLSQ